MRRLVPDRSPPAWLKAVQTRWMTNSPFFGNNENIFIAGSNRCKTSEEGRKKPHPSSDTKWSISTRDQRTLATWVTRRPAPGASGQACLKTQLHVCEDWETPGQTEQAGSKLAPGSSGKLDGHSSRAFNSVLIHSPCSLGGRCASTH
jgi:hypothetical protein